VLTLAVQAQARVMGGPMLLQTQHPLPQLSNDAYYTRQHSL